MNDDEDYLEEYDEDYDNSSSNSFITFYEENKKLVWVLGGIILLIILMLIIGGGNKSKSTVETEVTLSSTAESIGINHTVKLELKVNNDSNPTVNWSSSDTSVATVDNGLVRAVARGKAIITATYTDKKNKAYSETCEVTVFEGTAGVNLLSVSFKDGTVVMSPNSTYKLAYQKSPSNAMITSVNYSSTNENVVRVSKDTGELSAVAIGSSTVRVEVNNSMTATITVNVIDKQVTPNIYTLPSSLMIKNNEYNLVEGDKKKVEYTYLPSNATLKFVEWSSNNTSAVMVDENGYITAMGPGDAKITLTCGGVTSTTMVHVKAKDIPVKSITTTDTVVNLNVGDSHQILAVVSPSNATNQELEYISNNTSIIAVDSTGFVTALKSGNTTIKVRSKSNTSVSTTIKFNVTKESAPVDPDPGHGGDGGSSTSVGTVKITSNNNAVQSSYANALNNERVSYPTLTISGSGNYDSIKYCYYTYGNASSCNPNIIYNGPFTLRQNGVTVIRAQASYKGKDGTILTRYVNIKVNEGSNPPTQTSACYCNSSGSCQWRTSGNGYTIYTSLGLNECNAYINRGNQGCFTNNGNLVWGPYMGKSGYSYVSHITSSSSCTTTVTPPPAENKACYCNNNGSCQWRTSGNGYTISTTLTENACNAYHNRGDQGCFINSRKYYWGPYMGKSGYSYVSTITSSDKCGNGGSTPQPSGFTVDWGRWYGYYPAWTSVRGMGYKVNSNNSISRVYFCESDTTSACTINFNNATRLTKHFDLKVGSGNTYNSNSGYNKTYYFDDLTGTKFDFYIMTVNNHYLKVVAVDSNGNTSNSDSVVVNK